MAATIANSVDERDLGVVGAAQQMVTEVGLLAGIQVMQTVQVSRAEVVSEVQLVPRRLSGGRGRLRGGAWRSPWLVRARPVASVRDGRSRQGAEA